MDLHRGFFGTRADMLMDVAIVLFTALPIFLAWGIRLARRGQFAAHRRFQTATAALVFFLLALFEIDIRLSGGTKAFIAQGSLSPIFLRKFLLFHIVIASLTAILWLSLLWASRVRFGQVLPGAFSARHRVVGRLIFAGVCLLSSTGCALYVMLFALG